MDRWLNNSPFLAVGIYISGDSRGCRSQPNLTRRWITSQLDKGWRLLPITLGPQASCSPHFPRYGDDETIDPTPGPRDGYPDARTQGRAEGRKTVRAAAALGISRGKHAVVRPRRLRPHPDEMSRVGTALPQRLGDEGARTRLPHRRLLQRRLGDRDARPGPWPPAATSPTRTTSGSPGGTAWPTPARRTSVTSGGTRTAGSSSTKAATTKPGAASRSTSTATTSTSAGERSAPKRRQALRRSADRLVELQAARSRQRPAVQGQDPAVSAEGEATCTPAGSTAATTPPRSGLPTAGSVGWARPRRRRGRSTTGSRCSRTEARPCSRSAPAATPYDGCNGRSTPRSRDHDVRRHRCLRQRDQACAAGLAAAVPGSGEPEWPPRNTWAALQR